MRTLLPSYQSCRNCRVLKSRDHTLHFYQIGLSCTQHMYPCIKCNSTRMILDSSNRLPHFLSGDNLSCNKHSPRAHAHGQASHPHLLYYLSHRFACVHSLYHEVAPCVDALRHTALSHLLRCRNDNAFLERTTTCSQMAAKQVDLLL